MEGLDGSRMSDVSGRFYMKIIKRIRKKVFLNGMIFIEIIF
jgi:hypothetical protein